MSGESVKVAGLSRYEIRQLAQKVRDTLLPNSSYLEVVSLLEFLLPTVYPNLKFEVLDDCEMEGNHGLTIPSHQRIILSNTTYTQANEGRGRDRLTIAHEIGHYLLHNKVDLSLARRASRYSLKPYEDSEWQANAFAGELLMDLRLVQNNHELQDVNNLAKKFGVTTQAATTQLRAWKFI